ncbi:MAG: hypothetical protein HC781_15695, partial [Leptolyngbyaceae cyanobacterium CSU_1_4]|nr:hypothetical protein [Leptolyngbyaceae cyanobacterium CSU_1_4]
MLDAIAAIDNLGMEDSTLVADASTPSLETNPALSESQGSSMQNTDFNQSLMEMLSSLDALSDDSNPSLRIVSGQSVEDALADAIPGLDPTTLTPPAPLAQEDSSLNPFMMAALSELDDAETLGEAFQTVSDGFEGLSNSFEQLAASFLAQSFLAPDNLDPVAIAPNGDDASADEEAKPVAIDGIDDANEDDTDEGENNSDLDIDIDPVETTDESIDDDNTNFDTSSDTDSD